VDQKTFFEENWVGTAAVKLFNGADKEVQQEVLRKGPLLGPCPQKELYDRMDRAELKIREKVDSRLLREAEAAEEA